MASILAADAGIAPRRVTGLVPARQVGARHEPVGSERGEERPERPGPTRRGRPTRCRPGARPLRPARRRASFAPRRVRAACSMRSASQTGRATTVADADVEVGMAIEHTSEHQRRHGQGLLVEEAEPQVTIEAGQSLVPAGTVDAVRGGVEKTPARRGATQVAQTSSKARIVERTAQIGAEVRRQETQFVHGPFELGTGAGRILHRDLGEAPEAVGGERHQRGELVVVAPTEPVGPFGLHVGEVGQRVRGQHLQVDARRRPSTRGDGRDP